MCREGQSPHKGFQCIKKLASNAKAYDKQRTCRECIAEAEVEVEPLHEEGEQ